MSVGRRLKTGGAGAEGRCAGLPCLGRSAEAADKSVRATSEESKKKLEVPARGIPERERTRGAPPGRQPFGVQRQEAYAVARYGCSKMESTRNFREATRTPMRPLIPRTMNPVTCNSMG